MRPAAITLRRANRGFTLVELALVSLLILIMINVSTPLFRNTFHRVRLEDSCRNLSQLMHYLQTRSVVEGVRYRLFIDFAQGTYWGESERRSPSGTEAFAPLAERLGGRHHFTDGVTASGDPSAIVFHPDGRVDEAKLTLTGVSGIAYALSVHNSVIRVAAIEESPQ